MDNKQLEAARKIYDTPEWRRVFDSFKKEPIRETIVRHHRHCGSHSNIPSCCVEFFIKYWRGRMPESLIGRIYRFLKRCCYPVDRRPQYVVCPKCLIKRRAQPLYECDWQSESVRVGECKPTGRVIGFDQEDGLPDGVKNGSIIEHLLRRFRKDYVEVVIEYDSEDVDPVTGKITGRVIGFCNPALPDAATSDSAQVK